MSTTHDHPDADIRRRADGSIDTGFYADRARTARAAAFGSTLARWLGRRKPCKDGRSSPSSALETEACQR